MDNLVRSLLTEPFPEEDIRTRKGHNGTQLHYVESWRVIERLNEAFSHDWSFEILEYQVLEDEVLVKAELSCPGGITKQAFGSSSITRSRDTTKAVSLGDDLKSAASDALKKTASLLGVGLEVFSGQSQNKKTTPTQRRTASSNPRGKTEAPPPPSGSSSVPSMTSRITPDQVDRIRDLAEQCNLVQGPFLARIKKTYGVAVTELSSDQMEDLVGKLTSAATVIHRGSEPTRLARAT